jgi:hypothetical protein
MKTCDLVKWTFAKGTIYNKNNKYLIGILLEKKQLPEESWMILLENGHLMQGSKEEIEVINESG